MLVATTTERNETPLFSLVIFFAIATKRSFAPPLFLVIFIIAAARGNFVLPLFILCMFIATTIGTSPHFFLFHFVKLGTWGNKTPSFLFCLHFVTPNISGNSPLFLYVYVGHNKNHGFFFVYVHRKKNQGECEAPCAISGFLYHTRHWGKFIPSFFYVQQEPPNLI